MVVELSQKKLVTILQKQLKKWGVKYHQLIIVKTFI